MTLPLTPTRRPFPVLPVMAGVVVLIAIGLAVLLFMVTRPGIGLSPDSRSYVTMSQFIAAGKGVKTLDGDGKPGLFMHLAPGVSVLMAVGIKLGLGAQAAGRAINVIALPLGTVLIAAVAYFAGRRSALAAVAAAAAVYVSTPILKLYVSLISEPLFITELLAMLLCLFAALHRKSWRWGLAAAVVAGTIPMTRYAGLAIIGAAALALLLQWPDVWKRRATAAAVFFAIAALPTVAWLGYGRLQTGRVANRVMHWHPPSVQQWTDARNELVSWVVPAKWHCPPWVGVSVLVGTLVLVAAVEVLDIRHHRRDAARVLRNVCWLGAACYAAFIVTSITLFDAYTPMDYRILLPLRVMLVPVNAAALLAAVGPMFRWRPVMGLAYAGLIGMQTAAIPGWAKTVENEGLGFNSTILRTSPAINSVLSAKPGAIVYCNVADAAYLITGRFCKPYPPIFNNTTRQQIPHIYHKKLPNIWKDLHDTDGRVVFYKHNRRIQQIDIHRFALDLHLIKEAEFADGAIYKLDLNYTMPDLTWSERLMRSLARQDKLAKLNKRKIMEKRNAKKAAAEAAAATQAATRPHRPNKPATAPAG